MQIMRVAILWDIAQFIPYMNRCFGGMYYFHLQGRKSTEQETSLLTKHSQYPHTTSEDLSSLFTEGL
jgi:hypothetical protein